MIINLKKYFLAGVIFLIAGIQFASAQTESRTSIQLFGGVGFFDPLKLNSYNLATNTFSGYSISPMFGIGANVKLSKRFVVGEHASYMLSSKTGHKTNFLNFRTSLRFNFIKDKKFTPYIIGGINVNLASGTRDQSENTFDLDSNGNTVGSGISATKIVIRTENFKYENVINAGASLGAGFEIKVHHRIKLFAEYNIYGVLVKDNPIFKNEFLENNEDLGYHTVNMGVSYIIFKKEKQLLARLYEKQWRRDYPYDVKGTMIYKNNFKKYPKPLKVELTDTLENVIATFSTDDLASVFLHKGIKKGNYKFMLPSRKRRIERADLLILNYNQVDLADDETELEFFETDQSENILSRDGNFSVLLREGFQHQINLATVAENIQGDFFQKDTNCKVKVMLKDKYDSIVATIDTIKAGKFNFVSITPGEYAMIFQPLDEACAPVDFKYKFTGVQPIMRKQYNNNLPKDTLKIFTLLPTFDSGNNSKSEYPKGTKVKLIDPSGRVENSIIASRKNKMAFRNLRNPEYVAVYESPGDKLALNYDLKDRDNKVVSNKKFNTSQKWDKDATGPMDLTGKVVLSNPKDIATISVHIVDSTGKIRKSVPLQADGSFAVKDLPKGKYKAYYESSDQFVRGDFSYRVKDKSLKITKINLDHQTQIIEKKDTIHVAKERVKKTPTPPDTLQLKSVTKVETKEIERKDAKFDPIKNAITKEQNTMMKNEQKFTLDEEKRISEKDKQNNTTVTKVETKPKSDKVSFESFLPNNTYTDAGNKVNPDGYGVQLGSYFKIDNVKKQCSILKSKGITELYIQVIAKDKNDPSQGLIYRILAESGDKDAVLGKFQSYLDKGMEPILRKHLTPAP